MANQLWKLEIKKYNAEDIVLRRPVVSEKTFTFDLRQYHYTMKRKIAEYSPFVMNEIDGWKMTSHFLKISGHLKKKNHYQIFLTY